MRQYALESALVVIVLTCLVIGLPVPEPAFSGYGLNSSWDPGSQLLEWEVYVESGSPQAFKDFHVELGDGNYTDFEAVSMPAGWDYLVYYVQDGPGTWISFFGSTARTSGTFIVRYTGDADVVPSSVWRLTDDGDYNAKTGIIPGEGGNGALAPWWVGVNTEAKVAVHVLAHESRTCVDGLPTITDCFDIISTCPGNDVDFFPVFFDLVEYTGVEYSVEWPGTYSCGFTSCSDLTIGNIIWPAGTVPLEDRTDWISHAWFDCHTEPVAIPGWGWIYEPVPAMIRIVANTEGGFIWVAECGEPGSVYELNEPVCNFAAGIAGAIGESACQPSSVRSSTWGGIKHLFR
jgi:hypothetical protein